MKVGNEVKHLWSKITTPDKSGYLDLYKELKADDTEVNGAVTPCSEKTFIELVDSMPANLCMLDYDITVDIEDGTINLCLFNDNTEFTVYRMTGSNALSVVWNQDKLSGYSIFNCDNWPDNVVKAIVSDNPLYLYVTRCRDTHSKTAAAIASSCAWSK